MSDSPVAGGDWASTALRPFIHQLRDAGGESISALQNLTFESRYYSSILRFSIACSDGSTRAYLAKFPKAERRRGFRVLPPRLPADIDLAFREKTAYDYLLSTWKGISSEFVKPAYYHGESGMIVFPLIAGSDLWSRALAARLTLRLGGSAHWLERIRKLGADLAGYHLRTGVAGKFDLTAAHQSLQQRAVQLEMELPPAPENVGYVEADLVAGIKGFELRNARYDHERVYLFDPGHLKTEPAEADIARFLVSVQIAAWGTPFFPLTSRLTPVNRAFLEGYEERRNPRRELIAHFTKRELLKSWFAGIAVIRERRLPLIAERFAVEQYANAPYSRLWRTLDVWAC